MGWGRHRYKASTSSNYSQHSRCQHGGWLNESNSRSVRYLIGEPIFGNKKRPTEPTNDPDSANKRGNGGKGGILAQKQGLDMLKTEWLQLNLAKISCVPTQVLYGFEQIFPATYGTREFRTRLKLERTFW